MIPGGFRGSSRGRVVPAADRSCGLPKVAQTGDVCECSCHALVASGIAEEIPAARGEGGGEGDAAIGFIFRLVQPVDVEGHVGAHKVSCL